MGEILYEKNRKRSKPSFANINFVGRCNAKCFFCLGKQAEGKKSCYFDKHFSEWDNFYLFLGYCKENGIKKIYLTGLDSEPTIYPYVQELVDYLKELNFLVGIRTNGIKVDEKLYKSFNDEVGISIHSFNQETLDKIGISEVDFSSIAKALQGTKHRYAIVVNRYNKNEIIDMIEKTSQLDKDCYIQIRQVCDDNGIDGPYHDDILAFQKVAEDIEKKYPRKSEFENAGIYIANGVNVCVWRPFNVTVNSFNYFINGIISDNYFVIEGWEKNNK